MKPYQTLLIIIWILIILFSCENRTFEEQALVEIGEISNVTNTTAEINGNIIDLGNGIIQYGHCWSTNPDPTIGDSITQLGERDTTGTYTSQITGLSPETYYYVRAYVSVQNGVTYSEEGSTFTTLNNEIPVVSTLAITSITQTSVTIECMVQEYGEAPILARGLCWSKHSSPTVYDAVTSHSSGIGSYSETIVGLDSGTLYYVRAYAANEVGIGYGNILNFTTLSSY